MRHHEHDVRSGRSRLWWFRVRAVLAGGLVLGIGSAATVAAWNDGEYATATITAGTFQIEGSTSSATTGYSDHAASTSAAVLPFAPVVTAATPGTTTYASFWVRTKSTSVAGTVALQTPTFGTASTGLQSSLTYGVRLLGPSETCGSTAFSTPLGTTIVTAGTALGGTLAAPSPTIAAASGAVHQYCFAITLPTTAPNTAQGLVAAPNWQFLATAS
ncbi:SipW-dependent-type signal peptide-containing protein [Labedella endophytica]|uniref:Uncharacterized protein n=1 Tax=Labedella endophytica TaxID=1523160 RepID=A0A433JSS4_9MICO|nr:SipW-dependent-type signal peptide-containing protein [Labedella endophytica]RUR01448.1 hypothetical protein ELQ94_08095 [Labedella endophytica]